MDPSSYITPPAYPQAVSLNFFLMFFLVCTLSLSFIYILTRANFQGPSPSVEAGTSWDAITSAAAGILTDAGGFQAFLDTYGGMSGQAGSTYGGGVDTVMTQVTTADVTTADVTIIAETRQLTPQLRQEKGKAKTKGKTKQQAVPRPQREKKKAPGISTPYTVWSSSWKGPQSSSAMELVPAEAIEQYYLRNQLPSLNLTCYIDAAVDRSFWGVLFGHEDSGNLQDSVSSQPNLMQYSLNYSYFLIYYGMLIAH